MNMGHSVSSTATRAGPRIAKIVAKWHFVIYVRTAFAATTAESLNHVLIAIRGFARIVILYSNALIATRWSAPNAPMGTRRLASRTCAAIAARRESSTERDRPLVGRVRNAHGARRRGRGGPWEARPWSFGERQALSLVVAGLPQPYLNEDALNHRPGADLP